LIFLPNRNFFERVGESAHRGEGFNIFITFFGIIFGVGWGQTRAKPGGCTGSIYSVN
jgi:hypothetical protein